jgi:hypothetical protein
MKNTIAILAVLIEHLMLRPILTSMRSFRYRNHS